MVEKTRHRKIPEIVSWSETVACKGANLCISYDSQNRRVYRKADEDQSGSQETELYYVLDGNRVIEERVYSDEDLKRDYWYGVYIDEPVFGRCDLNDDNDFDDSDEKFYYLHNTQYSVHAILDTSGSIIEVYKNYQPYGAVDVYTGDGGDSDWWDGDETTGSLSGNYYLFTGRRYDPEADLMFYRNRMYSTSRGRFLQRDPIGYIAGMNLYCAYFVPHGVDPYGLIEYDQDCYRECMRGVEGIATFKDAKNCAKQCSLDNPKCIPGDEEFEKEYLGGVFPRENCTEIPQEIEITYGGSIEISAWHVTVNFGTEVTETYTIPACKGIKPYYKAKRTCKDNGFWGLPVSAGTGVDQFEPDCSDSSACCEDDETSASEEDSTDN